MLSTFQWIVSRITDLRSHSERGAAAVEYGLLVALIAVAIVTAVTILGGKVNDTFCTVVGSLPPFDGTTCPATTP